MIRIVVSGPNLDSAGPLSVMKDLLSEIVKHPDFEIIALVHSISLFQEEEYAKVKFIEYKDSKSSWFKRINYEYRKFYKLSLELKPDIWLSMHDITPNVKAKFLATYCHNASPFYKLNLKDFYYDKKFGLFTLFYKYLYKINITKNDYVFVQQNWIKENFIKMYNIHNVIVAKPNIKIDASQTSNDIPKQKIFTFFYPSFPRVFKNFEVICQAVKYLKDELMKENFKVILTIDGSENKYAKDIINKYKSIDNINFIGLIPREKVFVYYIVSDVLIFPSKLETWGLPISEFQHYNKPLIVSDLPYAKETVGNYSNVNFFAPNDYIHLAKIMKSHIEKNISYGGNSYRISDNLQGWPEFVHFIKNKYLEKNKI